MKKYFFDPKLFSSFLSVRPTFPNWLDPGIVSIDQLGKFSSSQIIRGWKLEQQNGDGWLASLYA
jgi:hypothetical protein